MASPLRILVSTLTPFPSATAHLVHITSTAQGLAEAGHRVLLVAAQRGPGWAGPDATSALGYVPRFTTRVLAGRDYRGQSAINTVRLAMLARRSPPDLCFSDNVRGAVAMAELGIPTLFEVHTLGFADSRVSRSAFRRLLASDALVGVITISRALRDDLAARFDLDPTTIHVAPEGAWPASPATEATPDWIAQPTRPGALQVGYTGSLYAGRGSEVLVEVARRCPEVDVHVLGGPREAAERLDSAPDAPPNLIVHGLRSSADARELQRAMDVLLAPYALAVDTPGGVDTARWMSPMKVFEYLAAGRAIVCSDLPVLREVLEPDVTAVLVPPQDVAAWADAVRALALDPTRRSTLGASARRAFEADYSWERRTVGILELFERFGASRVGERTR